MTDSVDPMEEAEADEPSIAQLARKLVDDARAFAQAEVGYLKAQAGERASYAMPGLAMIGAAIGLATGALVAAVVGMMFLLADYVGLGWSIVVTMVTASGVAFALVRIGTNRIKASLKARDKR